MNIVVVHQSRSGNTKKAAEQIGGHLVSDDNTVSVRSVSNLDLKELAVADLVFIGTWVDGLILLGHRPGDVAKINQIPPLWNKPVVAFMTHALNPGNAPIKLAKILESKGAEILLSQSINRKKLQNGTRALVDEALLNF